MKLRKIVVIIAAIYILGAILLFFLSDVEIDNDLDIIAVNEIVKTTEKNWGNNINESIYNSPKLNFTVIDTDEKVKYSTMNEPSPILNDAVKNRATIVDVIVNQVLVGKVIFPNDYQVLKTAVNRVYMIVLITFTALAMFCILYIIYINNIVLKPFSRLQSFARNVAAGKLNLPLEMDEKNIFGAFSESFDIMREELEKARKNEYLANQSKKELVASLSHDIKTPVSSIKAVSELMLVLATDEKEKQRINTIHFKAEQINLLISDMFHATLEELNELKVTLKDELSGVLEEIIQNVNYFDKITHDSIPECLIYTDVLRLQQVFDNILGNSYKYANTSVLIDFKIASTHLEVNIIDYGKGVDSEELPLLFNKFTRGKNAEGQSGSGLGLYISKYLMEKMEGDILCRNTGNGFMVTLKIKLA